MDLVEHKLLGQKLKESVQDMVELMTNYPKSSPQHKAAKKAMTALDHVRNMMDEDLCAGGHDYRGVYYGYLGGEVPATVGSLLRERLDLATLLRMSVHYLQKAARNSAVPMRHCDRCVSYLERHGLMGSPLRDVPESDEVFEWVITELPRDADGSGVVVASGLTPTEAMALQELDHYVMQYGKDGPIEAQVFRETQELIVGYTVGLPPTKLPDA